MPEQPERLSLNPEGIFLFRHSLQPENRRLGGIQIAISLERLEKRTIGALIRCGTESL